MKKVQLSIGSVLVMAGLVFVVGCSAEKTETATLPDATEVGGAEHDHGGWWCAEHGVPEEVCARCSTSLVAEFKEKGDWCEDHSRPESQCFVCQPELQAKFAAKYEMKFGELPGDPTEP